MTAFTGSPSATSPSKRARLRDMNSDAIIVDYSAASHQEHFPLSRQDSPAPSTSSSLTDLTNVPIPQLDGLSAAPPSKKRKMNFVEKEAERASTKREKEEKARMKAEERARKDEEKRSKDEERKRLAEEREAAKREKELEKAERLKEKQEQDAQKLKEKQGKEAKREADRRAKEAERQAREAEKAQKEAEKVKRERSQMKLGAFFAKPTPVATPPSTPDDISDGAPSRRSSIASIDTEKLNLNTQPTALGFGKYFLPFFVSEYTDVAPHNRFRLSKLDDFELTQLSAPGNMNEQFGRPRKRQKRTVNVKAVLEGSQNLDSVVIDLDTKIQHALKSVPYKCLQFREDVRPPYQGTYTRMVPARTSVKLSRNPFHRGLPDTNYDYDSEAEWEPPAEDDEDLEAEDAMSDAEDDEDEMADFLDDEDDAGRKKGPLMDMTPNSSGLCWSNSNFNDNGFNIKQYTMNFFHDSQSFPIDPFSTKHWEDELRSKPAPTKPETVAVMQPPRLPLGMLSQNRLPVVRKEVTIDGKPLPSSTKAPRLIDQEFMSDFKKAIHGSDLTKAGLIEILKKQFPKCSKDAIKDTLGIIAVRVGKKEVDKKWQLVDPV